MVGRDKQLFSLLLNYLLLIDNLFPTETAHKFVPRNKCNQLFMKDVISKDTFLIIAARGGHLMFRHMVYLFNV